MELGGRGPTAILFENDLAATVTVLDPITMELGDGLADTVMPVEVVLEARMPSFSSSLDDSTNCTCIQQLMPMAGEYSFVQYSQAIIPPPPPNCLLSMQCTLYYQGRIEPPKAARGHATLVHPV